MHITESIGPFLRMQGIKCPLAAGRAAAACEVELAGLTSCSVVSLIGSPSADGACAARSTCHSGVEGWGYTQPEGPSGRLGGNSRGKEKTGRSKKDSEEIHVLVAAQRTHALPLTVSGRPKLAQ